MTWVFCLLFVSGIAAQTAPAQHQRKALFASLHKSDDAGDADVFALMQGRTVTLERRRRRTNQPNRRRIDIDDFSGRRRRSAHFPGHRRRTSTQDYLDCGCGAKPTSSFPEVKYISGCIRASVDYDQDTLTSCPTHRRRRRETRRRSSCVDMWRDEGPGRGWKKEGACAICVNGCQPNPATGGIAHVCPVGGGLEHVSGYDPEQDILDSQKSAHVNTILEDGVWDGEHWQTWLNSPYRRRRDDLGQGYRRRRRDHDDNTLERYQTKLCEISRDEHTPHAHDPHTHTHTHDPHLHVVATGSNDDSTRCSYWWERNRDDSGKTRRRDGSDGSAGWSIYGSAMCVRCVYRDVHGVQNDHSQACPANFPDDCSPAFTMVGNQALYQGAVDGYVYSHPDSRTPGGGDFSIMPEDKDRLFVCENPYDAETAGVTNKVIVTEL